jgi:hypothetical protein
LNALQAQKKIPPNADIVLQFCTFIVGILRNTNLGENTMAVKF